MAITSSNFSSFDKGLGDANVSTTAATTQDGPANLNARITAAAMDGGVPVNNGPAKG